MASPVLWRSRPIPAILHSTGTSGTRREVSPPPVFSCPALPRVVESAGAPGPRNTTTQPDEPSETGLIRAQALLGSVASRSRFAAPAWRLVSGKAALAAGRDRRGGRAGECLAVVARYHQHGARPLVCGISLQEPSPLSGSVEVRGLPQLPRAGATLGAARRAALPTVQPDVRHRMGRAESPGRVVSADLRSISISRCVT